MTIDRRDFLRKGAALGAIALDSADGAAQTLPACVAPPPAPALSPNVGVHYGERFKGTLGGVPGYELEVEFEVDRLTEFLKGPHVVRVVGGSVAWGERLKKTPVRAGRAELFRACDGDTRELLLEFEYQDGGKVVKGRGVRTLRSGGPRDPAAELAELALTLEAGGASVASGTLTSDIDDLLARLLSVRALRAEGAAAIEARDAFLELWNRGCDEIHPGLPRLFDAKSPLGAGERRALLLVAMVMLPAKLPPGGPTPREAISRVEAFIANADQEALDGLRAPLRTLGGLAPLLDGHVAEIRRLVLEVLESEKPHSLRPILDSVHKVAVLGYYSHAKADRVVGYERPRFAPLYQTRLPVKDAPSPREFDVVIVGAGVAGSLLAERLTKKGKSVLILEAGPYVAEADLTTDEVVWIARLQKQSGLQRANEDEPYASRLGNVVLLQGSCVGGGGMLNNAVNFMLPQHRLEQWLGLGFPIAPAAMRRSYLATAQELDIGPVSDKTQHLNPVCALLSRAFGAPKIPVLGQPPAPGFYECMVNLAPRRCLGCGMCNTGCGSERKRNALQVHLPRALAPSRQGELVANARVVDIVVERTPGGSARVDHLVVATPRGRLAVRGREVVLSAGAINTSALMLRSRSLREATRSLPVGRRFCANVVSPILSFYERDFNLRPTLQLTHYYVPPGRDDGFLIENLFNPPGQSALVMPGYGERHYQRMLKYRSTALTGIAIGTQPNGSVTVDSTGRSKVTLPMAENEHRRMKAAFRLLSDALFQGGDELRPTEILAGVLGGGFSMKKREDVERFLDWFEGIHRIVLSTGHPQGGSAMSLDPRLSVVGADFRVRGISNLRVCDASLFPMVSGVNPQWTVLAIADHCGRVMNEEA